MSISTLRASLNLLQELGELLPVVHDLSDVALLSEDLLHRLHLLLALLDSIDTNIANARDASAHGRSGTTLAVLNSNRLFRLDTELLACIEVDLWVWLA